jgi:hypothetical protein
MSRAYKMPSTVDERKQLVSEIAVMAERILGYPARHANVEGWLALPMVQLRLTHKAWTEADAVIARKRAGVAEVTVESKSF